jgi:hypothetical protein
MRAAVHHALRSSPTARRNVFSPQQDLLLADDADRFVKDAQASNVLK